jgi:dimethylargininase
MCETGRSGRYRATSMLMMASKPSNRKSGVRSLLIGKVERSGCSCTQSVGVDELSDVSLGALLVIDFDHQIAATEIKTGQCFGEERFGCTLTRRAGWDYDERGRIQIWSAHDPRKEMQITKRGIAITREVSRSIEDCQLTHLARYPIDLSRARRQHSRYLLALEAAGWEVQNLPEEPDLPDSVFVEDTAIVLEGLIVITQPGAVSRRLETESIERAVAAILPVATLPETAFLDGGDVLVVGKKIFVGLSSRSKRTGVSELAKLAQPIGYQVVPVRVSECLHLKSAVTALDPKTLLIHPQWVNPDLFGDYRLVEVHPDEPDGANCVDLGSTILYGDAYPKTMEKIQAAGFEVHAIPMDELAKAEGAATCCSLLIPNDD